MTVRLAQEEDFARVTELLEILGRAEVTTHTEAECRHVFEVQLAGQESAPLVVEDDAGEVIAFCSLHFRPRLNRPAPDERLPARTERSDAMSKALRAHGFRFVGSTICYAFMQATGMVDDHMAACFRASRAAPAAGSSGRPPA